MKKSSLVAVILLAVASVGITAIFSSQVSINGFLLSVYSTASGNQQIQKVDAQTTGNGTVTINVQICQSIANDGSCVSPRDPSSAEKSQFSYDIQRLVGQGANTQISTVLSGIGPGQYSLSANIPNAGNNNRDNYSVSFKGAPTNYNYFSGGGFTDLYAFSISAGQNTEVDIPYTIYQNIEQLGSAGTTVKADIVDGNGNFVRALSDSETQSTGFDIQFSSITQYGGSVGSLANNFGTDVSSGKLNTSYDLQSYVHGYNTHILTNIKPPVGYVVRSIDPAGTYFSPNADASNTVTIHFTKAPSPSLTQSADDMLYVPNGISYVKKIAQTYSDTEYKYVNTDVDLFNYHGNNNRPFPLNWSISKYSGVPYLFMDAVGKIVVYNISDPANPKQVNEFLLSKIQNFNEITHHTGAGDEVYGPCSPENLGTHAFITSASKIFTLDDSPYILVDVGYDYAVKGTAVFSLDPSTMQIAAYPQWTNCGNNSAYGMYKGSDGSTYFVSTFIDSDGIGIYTINSAGVIIHSAILSKSTGMSVSGAASDLNYNLTSVFRSGNKTYLIGPGSGSTISPVYIYDISDPKNMSKISQNITTNGKVLVDEQAKRSYVQSSIPNPAATSTLYSFIPKTLPTWQVYDLSVLPNAPKLIATYTKATDLLNTTQLNADLAEIAKRLNITPSGNLIDISNYSLAYGGSSTYLINVSNNLAYISLYTNGKTPWDMIANQAGVTDRSEYGTNVIQFIVDLSNATQPKILGMILGHSQYPFATSGWSGWFDIPLSGSIFDYNGYIYRANYRIADIWKLGNPPAQSTGTGTGASGTGTTGGGSAPSSIQSPFSFSSLLRIFQRVFNNQ